MSTFDSMITDHGTPLMLDIGGRSVIYEEPDADPVTLTAIVGDEIAEPQADADSDKVDRVRMVDVPTDSTTSSGYIADPKRYAKVTIDGEEYVVDEVQRKDGTMCQLKCIHVDTYELHRDRYRG